MKKVKIGNCLTLHVLTASDTRESLMEEQMKGKSEFGKFAEETRSRLSKRGQYGSSSDLHIDEKAEIAIIGIQTSGSGSGHDSIYVLKRDGGLENVLDKNFRSGRMWPTGILEDGTGFKYTIKDEGGNFNDHIYKI